MARKSRRDTAKAGKSAGSGKSSRTRRVAGQGKESDQPKSGGALEWIKSIGIALLLFVILRTFLIQTFVITSGSMEDTLLVGDFLMVNRLALGSRIPGTQLSIPGYSTPARGEIIVFDPPHEDDLMLVKRLIGMPGDTLEMRNKMLYRGGEPVDEPYVQHLDTDGDDRHPWMEWQKDYLVDTVDAGTYRPSRDNWGPIVIPPDRYFMLGDNRDRSLDSRYWGLLERWRLEGRAVFTYFSYNKGSYRPFPWIREVRWDRIGDPIR